MSEDLTASAPPKAANKIINNKRAQMPSTFMSLLDPFSSTERKNRKKDGAI